MAKSMKKVLITLLLLIPLYGFSQNEWYQLQIPEQGYSIEFPSQPKASNKTIPSEIGQLLIKMQILDYSKETNKSTLLYLSNHTLYPKEYESFKDTANLPTFYKEAIHGAVTNVNGKLISEKDVFYEKYPGKEIKIDYGNGYAIITARMFLIGYDMYMIQTITETAKDNNAEMQKYFDSFKLIEKTKQMKKEFLGLRTTIYKVPNLIEAKEWYEQAFDAKAYFVEDFYVGFNIGGYELGLLPEPESASPKSENVLSYWGVDDINESYSRLIENGATEHEKPMNVGGELWVASVKDPWDNVIGIIYNPAFTLE